MTVTVSERPRGPGPERLRIMAVTARLYHVHGLRQRDIGQRLGMSQARVSRLLQEAAATGMVRTVVAAPEGLHCELEELLEERYGLDEVHVVDTGPAVEDLAPVLGRAAARYLGESGLSGQVVGFTSWSRTLQEMAHALAVVARPVAQSVVEMLGDLGSPLLQHSAARSTQAMARALGAEPVFLRTPGVVATPELRSTALRDPHVSRALELLEDLDIAFVGVGPPDVHSALRVGDRYFTPHQLSGVRTAGAASQLNQRFLDRAGGAVATALDQLVVGSTLQQVRNARRRIVVAGGPDKHEAIASALTGGWIDVLISDDATARFLAAATGP